MMSLFACYVNGSITLNESYNRPHYISAASAENKNKKSMGFILYRRGILAKVSSSNVTSTGCLILEMEESEKKSHVLLNSK